MKGRFKKGSRVFALLLSCMMALTFVTTSPVSIHGAETTKIQKSYEIAVVFDNSGSMYNNKGWSRAKYAMEIFASMLNYDNGDKLSIYPMWEVKTDGSKPEKGGSYQAIEISSKDDIDKISNLYTVNPNNTPFAPVVEAYKDLKDSAATDKWIVVLTDGKFNQVERGVDAATFSGDELRGRLLDVAKNDIKVQYLGFGSAAALSSNEAKGFFAKKSSDTSLKDDLIGICNAIFQRSILPKDCLQGKNLDVDMSMKNLIVFAQGSDAKISGLKNESGKSIDIILDSGQRKYNSIKAKGYEDAPIDKTLAGQVVTFDACEKGKYILEYSDAQAIQIFYEPDVDLKVAITDSEGKAVKDFSKPMTAGEYQFTSSIVDSKTGDDVTNHELMGSDVSLVTKVKTSSEAKYKEYPNGSKIEFKPDGSTDILVVGTYLKDYTITSAGDSNLNGLSDMEIITPGASFKAKATVLQKDGWYNTRAHEKWQPIEVKLSVMGKALTDEELKRVKIDTKSKDGIPCRAEAVPGQSAYHVYICQDEKGNFVKPEAGVKDLDITATYQDEYGKENVASDKVSFEIQKYAKFWKWLFWVIIAAILLAIITFLRNRPALPKEINLYIPDVDTSYLVSRSGDGWFMLSSGFYSGELNAKIKAASPFKTRGKRSAKVELLDIDPMGAEWYDINGMLFTTTGDLYTNPAGKTVAELNPKIKLKNGTTIAWKSGGRVRDGVLYINHK